jgi:hypothetical protein
MKKKQEDTTQLEVIEYQKLKNKYYNKELMDETDYEVYQYLKNKLEPNMYLYKEYFESKEFKDTFGVDNFYWGVCL